ncbi:MAG: hypothetical protein RLY43_2290 [Bacteroidota bacterium]|jgi:hypothetical protein
MSLLKKDERFVLSHWRTSTGEKHVGNLNSFIKRTHDVHPSKKNIRDLEILLQDMKLIEEYCEPYKNTGTKANKYSTFIAFMREKNKEKKDTFKESDIEELRQLMQKNQKGWEDDKLATKNKHRKNIVKQQLNINHMYECLDYWEKENPLGIEHLTMATLCYILPRRLDWRLAEFVDKKPEKPNKNKNYIIIDVVKNNVELLFFNFKTSNKMQFWNTSLDKEDFDFSDEVVKVLPRFNPEKLKKLIIKSYKENYRKYFLEFNGTLMKQPTFTTKIKNMFMKAIGKDVNATDTRAIVISQIFNNPYLKLSSQHEKEIAVSMGQTSTETQRMYRIILESGNYEVIKLHDLPEDDVPPEVPPNEIDQEEKTEVIRTLESLNRYILQLEERYSKLRTK